MDVEPVIPPPREDDDDDVAWALQTAAVQWDRGSFSEAVVWVKRAVDAAIASSSSARTKELSRAAAHLVLRAAEAEKAAERAADEVEEIVEIDDIDDIDDIDEADPSLSRDAEETLPDIDAAGTEPARAAGFPPPRRAGQAPPPPRARAGSSAPPRMPQEADATSPTHSGAASAIDPSEAIRQSLLHSEPPPPLEDTSADETVLSVRSPRPRADEGPSLEADDASDALTESYTARAADDARAYGTPIDSPLLDDEPDTETLGRDEVRAAVDAALSDPSMDRQSDLGVGRSAVADSGELGDPLDEPLELPRSEPPGSTPVETSMSDDAEAVVPASESVAPAPPSDDAEAVVPASESVVPAADISPESLDFSDEPAGPGDPEAGDLPPESSPPPLPAEAARPSDVPNEAPETVDLRDRLGLDLEFPDEEGPLTSPPPAPSGFPPRASSAPPARPSDDRGEEDADRVVVDGIFLDEVKGFEDLPEDGQASLAKVAAIEQLSVEEEVGAFGAALVTRGAVGILPAIADVAAGIARAGDVVFTNGSLEEGVTLRVVALEEGTRVASWKTEALDEAFADCPWVADELREVADRFQALAGATLGDLGDRLDDSLRGIVTERLEVRALEAGDVLVQQGEPVPGLVIVGAGRIETVQGQDVTDELGPGDFVFAAEVMSAGAAPATARAGKGGALLLFASRAAAHELLVSVPPLLEIMAG